MSFINSKASFLVKSDYLGVNFSELKRIRFLIICTCTSEMFLLPLTNTFNFLNNMLMQFLLASWCGWIFQMMKLSGEKRSNLCQSSYFHIIINIRRNNFTTETLEHVVLNNDKPRLSFSTYTVQLSWLFPPFNCNTKIRTTNVTTCSGWLFTSTKECF